MLSKQTKLTIKKYYKPSRELGTATEWTVEKGWSKEIAVFLHHVCSTEYYWKKGVAAYLNLWINLSWEHILQHKYQGTSETHGFCNHSPICDPSHSNSVNEEQPTKPLLDHLISYTDLHLSYLIEILKPLLVNILVCNWIWTATI